MAQAKKEGGLYYRPIGTTGKFVAVDANGEQIKDAPKRPKDTPTSEQPGAGGVLTPEERLAVAVARATKDPDAFLKHAGGTTPRSLSATSESSDETTDEHDSDEEEGLPTLADMPAHLAGIDDVDEIKSLRRQDKRKGAKPLYEARLAELEG